MTVWTIGHSNRSLEFLITLLQGYGVQCLVDIRTIPRSRHNPQFNQDSLAAMLPVVGMEYRHQPDLGGLRHTRKDSLNTGWTNSSFRGYADYMQTLEFNRALDSLIVQAKKDPIAIMCAEAVPWRCHRSLVADALSVRGVQVRHIMSRVQAPRHALTAWAVIHGTQVRYPSPQPELPLK